MSLKSVKEILGKAQADEGFRDLLLRNPEAALQGFDLTENEVTKFKKADVKQLTAFKNNLDKRYSKDGSGSGGGDDDWWVESVTD